MEYRKDRYGNLISQLGFGCMRFQKKGGSIDYELAKEQIRLAIEKGINYFDTAYIYSGSEETIGRIFEELECRDKIHIATKLPQYIIRSDKAIDKIFNEELTRLRTNYVDYYLMHMFTDYSEWENLKKHGIEQWISDRKADGSIKQIGFSYHGETEMFLKILNAYDWDFCQIQYNYLDENTQAGRKGLEAAHAKGIPVVIMEPLRGGKLVNLPDAAKKVLAEDSHGYSAAELGLRWLWNQEAVSVILSGMNTNEMVEENTRIASNAQPGHFTSEDFEIVEKIKSIIREREKVGCTGCRYCMPCPKGVDIPGNFYYYNLMYMEKKSAARFEFAQNMGLRKDPGFASQCVGCGKCEQHCPQHIQIRECLKKADKELRPLPYKIGINVARKMLVK
ncbi:MAG: aldo/keto reductase [Lachnospiraceae bacterium]|nr:aldo/keto reductase [Candidatus Merdinaster equi]